MADYKLNMDDDEPKPRTPEFGVRAVVRKSKIGKKDLAKVPDKKRVSALRALLEALLPDDGELGEDARNIKNRIDLKDNLVGEGSVSDDTEDIKENE